jgi:hypothetical protein
MRLVMMSRFIAFTWLIGGPGRWQHDAPPEYNER